MLIDTHCHLYLDEFKSDLEQVIERAKQAGVRKILLPNIDENSIRSMFDLQEKYPQLCYPMVGLHPCDVHPNFEKILMGMEPFISSKEIIAIGETGIDLFWEKSTLDLQIKSFEIQIKWAKKYNLPLVIHARDSFQEIVEVLDRHADSSLRGVFHCFTGSVSEIERVTDFENFYFGIGGASTYPKNKYQEILPLIPLEKIILETDAPFLPPVPHRGKRNEPCFVAETASFVAKALKISRQELEHTTSQNAFRLFWDEKPYE
ncbi:MAG: TatD family hydrolase [Bacteroidota bacterium]